MGFLKFCNRSIEYLFYALLLLVPLVFAGNTSELFEFNKMWLTYGITIAIGFFWFSKMLLLRRFVLKRTILDLPIAIFLISQIVSTLISLDPHVSIWGYYSRFNGGLLSIVAYIFLYYAFVSNFTGEDGASDWRQIIKKSLIVSVFSGLVAVLWALPSHFGYDPTCLVFRGHFDTSCWTADFVPTIRIFGPLGQPDWLAGYLGVLLPISAAFGVMELKEKGVKNLKFIFYAVSFFLFYLALLYTGSRSGIASGILTTGIFFLAYIYLNKLNKNGFSFFKNRLFASLLALILILSFVVGVQLPILNKISLDNLVAKTQKVDVSKQQAEEKAKSTTEAPQTSGIELGGSNSFKIRLIVWEGAINIWKANPIFGTGVETYAFAYYKYRPVAHNLVSEWNFLYNKAHNEYLNFLATTGTVGLLSYLFFIGSFLAFSGVNIWNINVKNKYLLRLKSSTDIDPSDPLPLALFFSFLSILLINFFGFSVVILNVYLFLIPAFMVLRLGLFKKEQVEKIKLYYISYLKWGGVLLLGALGIFMLYLLGKYWVADTKYALGFNYNRAGEYQTAYPLLHEAVKLRNEPVFRDELSINDAILATGFASQNSTESAQMAQKLANEAIQTNNSLVQNYPNNIIFWKTRVRIYYNLAAVDPRYYASALEAIQKVYALAPTDASVLYNLGVLYGQNGDSKKAAEVLEKTVEYKPDYREAHFALAIFYHDLAVDKSGKVTNRENLDKAIAQLNYILKNLNPGDQQAKEYLAVWENEK